MAISSSHSQHLENGPLVAPTQNREVGWTPMAIPLVHPLKGSDPLNVSHIKFSPLRHGLFSVFTGPSTWENLRKMDRGINCVAPTAEVGFKATPIPNTSLFHHPFQSSQLALWLWESESLCLSGHVAESHVIFCTFV